MICSDLCDLPIYIQRSCQSGSKIKEAIHSRVWKVMSEHWHCTENRSKETPQDNGKPDICPQWTWELVMFRVAGWSEIYPQFDRGARGVQCHRYHWRWKNRDCFSGGKWFHSIWLHQRNSVFFYLKINILCGDLFISLFSGHFLLTNGPFFYPDF